MPWKQDMKIELQATRKNLEAYQANIHSGMKFLESKKSDREKTRKEIILREMKTILAKLNQDEMKVIADMKSEAFDIGHNVRMFEEELEAMEKALLEAPDDDTRLSCDGYFIKYQITMRNFEVP